MTGEDKKPQATITAREDAYKGHFKVEKLTIEMERHDGEIQTVTRENFERGHAVGILAYDPKTDKVLLVNELRTGMLAAGEYPFNDAVPAGMIDDGETPLDAALRETREETGQELGDAKLLHAGAYVSAGGTSERLGLAVGTFDATKAGGVHGEVGEGESINTVLVSSDEFIARGKDGRLKDLKSLIFSFWLAAHRDEMRDPAATAAALKPVDKKIGDVFAPPPPKKLNATITERKTLYKGEFAIEGLTIEQDLHQGGTQVIKRLNYERGNSIGMIGYDPLRDEVILVNEMRSGPLAAGEKDPYTDSVPAAILKDGDDALEAAERQMKRKTGLALKDAVVIHPGAFPTSGGSSEKIVMVAGIVDTTGADGVIHGMAPDSFKNIVLKSDEFIARAEKGELKDMKSLAFAFWLENNRKSLQDKAAAAATPEKKVGKDSASRKIAGLG